MSEVEIPPLDDEGEAGGWQSRIVGLEMHKPKDLLDHPHQWRAHPVEQLDGLRAVLDKIGIVDALLAWRSERAGGRLVTFDGHGRKSLDPEAPWPVLVTDLNDDEADEALAYLDSLTGMATAQKDKLTSLLTHVKERLSRQHQGCSALLTSIAVKNEVKLPGMSPLPQLPPIHHEYRCPKCGHEWTGKRKP